MAFAENGRYLVQNSPWVGELLIYDRKTELARSQHFKKENQIGRYGNEVLVPVAGTGIVAATNNGKFGERGAISLYDLKSEARFRLIARDQTVGSALAALPSSREIVAPTSEGDLTFWNVVSGKVTRRWKGFSSRQTGLSSADKSRYAPAQIAVSPDEKYLATAGTYLDVSGGGSFSSTLLNTPPVIWNAVTGQQITVCETPDYPKRGGLEWSRVEMTSLVWSPNGKWLATDSRGDGVVVWNAATGKLKWMLSHPRNQQGHTITLMYGGGGVLFSPDSKQVLAPGNFGNPGTIDVYDLASGQLNRQIQGAGPMALAPDTRELFYQFPRDKVSQQKL